MDSTGRQVYIYWRRDHRRFFLSLTILEQTHKEPGGRYSQPGVIRKANWGLLNEMDWVKIPLQLVYLIGIICFCLLPVNRGACIL